MEKHNVKRALHVRIQLKREGNIAWIFFCRSIWAPIEGIIWDKKLHRMTWHILCKDNGASTDPKGNALARSTTIDFM